MITNDVKYIGVNDHKIDLFEGQYIVPNGMAYNSYAILDEKVAIMDSVCCPFRIIQGTSRADKKESPRKGQSFRCSFHLHLNRFYYGITYRA